MTPLSVIMVSYYNSLAMFPQPSRPGAGPPPGAASSSLYPSYSHYPQYSGVTAHDQNSNLQLYAGFSPEFSAAPGHTPVSWPHSWPAQFPGSCRGSYDWPGPGSEAAPGYNSPSETHDVTGFYPDIGPDKDLEAIISERINNELRVQPSTHVIKERDHDDKTKFRKNNSSKSARHPLKSPVIKDRNKIQNFQNQVQKSPRVIEKNSKPKVEGKWPEVSPCYTRYNGHHHRNGPPVTENGSDQLINQLNNLRRLEDHCSQDVEVGGNLFCKYFPYPLLFRDHLTSRVFSASQKCCQPIL